MLHFDVNKTIIMADKAQDSDMTQMINMLLSECAWGRLEPGPLWVPVGRLATDRYPAHSPSSQARGCTCLSEHACMPWQLIQACLHQTIADSALSVYSILAHIEQQLPFV